MAEAAHELRLAPNTVSTLVGRLAGQGLLGRGTDTADRRAGPADRGPGGRGAAGGLAGPAGRPGRPALAGLTEADRQALAAAVPALLPAGRAAGGHGERARGPG